MNIQDRRFQITRILVRKAYESGEFNSDSWMTLREIARECDLRPNMFIRVVLQGLVESGHLLLRSGVAQNGMLRYEYRCHENTHSRSEFHFRDWGI